MSICGIHIQSRVDGVNRSVVGGGEDGMIMLRLLRVIKGCLLPTSSVRLEYMFG